MKNQTKIYSDGSSLKNPMCKTQCFLQENITKKDLVIEIKEMHEDDENEY